MKTKGRITALQENNYGSEIVFLITLAVYLLTYLVPRIHWMASNETVDMAIAYLKLILNMALQWLAALNFALFAADIIAAKSGKYKKQLQNWLFLPLTILLGLFIRVVDVQSWTLCSMLIMLMIILTAAGKDFNRITQLFLLFFSLEIAVAQAGIPLGVTFQSFKSGDYGTGYAFGMTYPNTWARAVFLVMLLAWYLHCRKQIIGTALVFGIPFYLVFVQAKCRTIALLILVLAIPAMWLTIREGKIVPIETTDGKGKHSKGIRFFLEALLVLLPLLCLIVTLALALNMETVHRLTYGNYLRNMGKRFVQAGIALKQFGFHIFGQSIPLDFSISMIVNGEEEALYILDNGFIAEGLMKGFLWLLLVIGWQAAGIFRCLKEKDYRILLIGIAMVLLTLMEREGLYVNYNLMLLYPLAALTGAETGVKAGI